MPPYNQVGESRVQSDSREKIYKQAVPGLEVENYLDVEQYVDQECDRRSYEATAYRFRDIVFLKPRELPIQVNA